MVRYLAVGTGGVIEGEGDDVACMKHGTWVGGGARRGCETTVLQPTPASGGMASSTWIASSTWLRQRSSSEWRQFPSMKKFATA